MQPQVLFVSKPAVEPFNDGSKCLVRDLAGALTRYAPRIMVPRNAVLDTSEVGLARVYSRQGGYRPALADNVRVLLWLLTRSREPIWHFVFAPNRRTSQMGRILKRLRAIPVVQTVASPPRSFVHPSQLLFGDVVVTQSEWTKHEFLRAYADAGAVSGAVPRFEVIAPSVPSFEQPSIERRIAMRAQLSIDDTSPVILYPGDLEVSHGAQWVAAAVAPLVYEIPNVVVVFAYRHKSPRAAERAQALQRSLSTMQVRFIAEVLDMHALLACSRAVLFPVDDLYGKVDLPIVLLEAMQLGVPVVALDRGPLADLDGVLRVAPGDIAALANLAIRLVRDEDCKQAIVAAQHAAIERKHRPTQLAKRYEAIYDELLALPR